MVHLSTPYRFAAAGATPPAPSEQSAAAPYFVRCLSMVAPMVAPLDGTLVPGELTHEGVAAHDTAVLGA